MGVVLGVSAYRSETDGLGPFAQLTIDLSVYSETAVLKTAYWFTDSFYIFLAREPHSSALIVEVRPKSETDGASLPSACGDFANRLLDAEVRQKVLLETSSIRDTLIRKAFFEAKAKTPDSLVSNESRMALPHQSEDGDPVAAGRKC